jgi:sodium-dependent dicarboxylate transporter 2/3/5
MVLILLSPIQLPPEQRSMLAIMVFALIWWVGEAIPLPITALLIPVLGVLLGIDDAKDAFSPFGSGILFLFIGSFILAKAITLHGVDRRFATFLLGRRFARRNVLISIGLIAAAGWGLSMWISNTAAVAMLLPLILGLLKELRKRAGNRIVPGGLLLLAFAASPGGVATPVGTPPNLVGIAMLEQLADVKVSFAKWFGLSLPISLLMFVMVFGLLYFIYLRKIRHKSMDMPEAKVHRRFTQGQKNTLIAFSVTVALWVLPGILAPLLPLGGFRTFLQSSLKESIVAVLGASLLFILPINPRQGTFTITWKEATQIDWGTVLLFGGGLCLGRLATVSGLADTLGAIVLAATGGSEFVFTLIAVVVAVLLTKGISNTATATLLLPIVITVAKNGGFSPFLPAYGVCLGASMSFTFPISTPPNAIVYGTGKVPLMEMIKSGALLDVASIVLVNLWLRVLKALGV